MIVKSATGSKQVYDYVSLLNAPLHPHPASTIAVDRAYQEAPSLRSVCKSLLALLHLPRGKRSARDSPHHATWPGNARAITFG